MFGIPCFAQEIKGPETEIPCGQEQKIRDTLISQAEEEEFNVRWIVISGNTYTRGRDFFKRINPVINEGDIFTLKNLEKAVKRVSKMRTIYPISIENVEVRTERMFERNGRTYNVIDVIFCVRQKQKN